MDEFCNVTRFGLGYEIKSLKSKFDNIFTKSGSNKLSSTLSKVNKMISEIST